MKQWHKRSSDKYHPQFRDFMALGPRRSIAKFHAALPASSETYPTWLKRAKAESWRERAQAYDAHIAQGFELERKHFGNVAAADALAAFRKLRGFSDGALDALHDIAEDTDQPAAARINAAKHLLSLTGYKPPVAEDEEQTSLSAEERAVWIDALTTEERGILAKLHAKGDAAVAALKAIGKMPLV